MTQPNPRQRRPRPQKQNVRQTSTPDAHRKTGAEIPQASNTTPILTQRRNDPKDWLAIPFCLGLYGLFLIFTVAYQAVMY